MATGAAAGVRHAVLGRGDALLSLARAAGSFFLLGGRSRCTCGGVQVVSRCLSPGTLVGAVQDVLRCRASLALLLSYAQGVLRSRAPRGTL